MRKSINIINFKFYYLLVFLFIGIITLIILAPADPHRYAPGRDGGFFMYAGKELTKGAKLYIDVWDSKPPLIFYTNALSLFLSNGSRWGIWFAEFLFMFFGLLIGWFTTKKSFGFLSGVILLSSFGILLPIVFSSGNLTEEYPLLFTWISIFIFFEFTQAKLLNLNHYLLGGLLALGFFYRPNNIGTTVAAILSIAFLIWKQASRTKSIVFFLKTALSASIIALLIIAYHLLNANLNEMIKASFIYNFSYSKATNGNFLINIFYSGLRSGFVYFRWWFAITLVSLFAVAYRSLKYRTNKQDSSGILFLICAFTFEVIFASISGRSYRHYFISMVPILCLILAFVSYKVLPEILKIEILTAINGKAKILVLLIACFIMTTSNFSSINLMSRSIARLIFRPKLDNTYTSDLAEYLEENTTDDQRSWVIGGQCGENFMADRSSISGALFYPLILDSQIGLEQQEKVLHALMVEKPKYIVDGHKDFIQFLPAVDPLVRLDQEITDPLANNTEEVLNYIIDNYIKETEIGNYIVYRKNP